MREAQCAEMRSVEDFAQMGLNESQANAVSSLVQCPHVVRLVQGPPGLESSGGSARRCLMWMKSEITKNHGWQMADEGLMVG